VGAFQSISYGVMTLRRPGGPGSVRLFCDTVNVCPPTVIVPLRGTPRLTRTANVTEPDPVPELTVVIHDTFDCAVQAHPVDVLTLNVPVSALPLTLRLLGDRL
jgi:hypothetical protein